MEEVNALLEWHTAEQMALGQVLINKGEISTVGDRNVYHYWHKGPRRHIRAELQHFFQIHSPETLLLDPGLAQKIKFRRSFSTWLRDKIRRLI